MGTINYNMVTRIGGTSFLYSRREHRDGSTSYICSNCKKTIVHDEAGTIRLGILPHHEGEEDSEEAGTCVRRTKK